MMLGAFAELAGGLDQPEGIVWGPDGFLYAGGEAGQVYRIGLDGSVEEIARTGADSCTAWPWMATRTLRM